MRPSKSLQPYAVGLLAAGLFISFFPWFFTYQGQVGGLSLSIRSLGKVLGAGLILAGLFSLKSKLVRQTATSLAIHLEALTEKEYYRWVFGATALFLMGAISHKFRAHAMLSTHAFDLGFFSNICWNIAQGNWFFSSLLERNFLGIHANWILWPLAIFYRWFADARVLLAAQAVFMGAAVPVMVILWHRITGSKTASLLGGVLFVCSPYFQHSLFNDFHPDTWALPLLTISLWAYYRQKPFVLFVTALAAILAKEDISIVVIGYSVFLMARGQRRLGLTLFVFSAAIFYGQVGHLIPKLIDTQESSLLLHRYGHLGKGFKAILVNLLTQPPVIIRAVFYDPMKYWRMICMIFPTGGLALAAPFFLLPAFISLLPHLLSISGTQLSLADIYAIPSQPFVFVAAAVGLSKLLSRPQLRDYAYYLACGALVVAGWGIINSPRTFRTISTERRHAFLELKKLVPAEASVAAQQNLLSHFDSRRYVQIFPIGNSMPVLQRYILINPDFIVCDRIGNALPYTGAKLNEAISSLEQENAYEKIFDRENFLVFRRVIEEKPKLISPFSDNQEILAAFYR